ncbi:MAG: response regulator [Thaumarchaeota archaeon]|nr:response regulator [Nitrososphaerota archaeon]
MQDKIRVMLVDDSALIRKLSSDILSSDSEIEVCCEAIDGKEALSKLNRHKPDVVVLDLEMPKLDGLEFINRSMENKPIPIVVLSSYAQEGSKILFDALEAGDSFATHFYL